MSSIFGGSKSKSTSTSDSQSNSSSYNQAYPQLQQQFSPIMQQANTGANYLAQLLGGDSTGFDAYKKATGFDALADQGSTGILGNNAARGLLRSGSSGKSLQSFGQNLQNQFAGSFMDKLLQQAGLGFQAGNALSGAGGVSNSTSKSTGLSDSTSKSKPGIGGFLGALATGGAA